MFIALDEQKQRDAYQDLHLLCKSTFKYAERRPGWIFYRYSKHCKDEDNYGLSVYDGPKTFGISLDGYDYSPASKPMRMVLKFATYGYESGTGRTAALLASDTRGQVALLHDGRVFKGAGRGSPFLDRRVIVDHKEYYFISYLKDKRLLSQLVRFQKSRNANSKAVEVAQTSGKDAYDPGSEKCGTRGSVYFEARHHPVTLALKAAMTERKWQISQVSGVSPDLVVERNGSKVLFEVKPSGASHDLMVGISQLMIYNKFVFADHTCLVTQAHNDTPLSHAIMELILENNIEYVEYIHNDRKFIFKGLDAVLNENRA